jgi:hypothetical protein
VLFFVGLGLLRLKLLLTAGSIWLLLSAGCCGIASMLGLLERLVERILFALLGYGSARLARCLVHVLVVI